MKNRYSYAFIGTLSLFFTLALLRILTFPLNFWVDEIFHVFAAQGILTTGQPILPSGLLYTRSLITTLLVAGSLHIFGISEFAARLPFVLVGAAAIGASYFLAKEVFDQRVALVTAILLAISPWQIYWSTNARMYILLQLVYIVFLLLMYRAWDEWRLEGRGSRVRLLMYAMSVLVVIALAFQLHEFGILFVLVGVAFLIYLGCDDILERIKILRNVNTTILFIAAVAGIAILVYLAGVFGIVPLELAPTGMRWGELFYLYFMARFFPVFVLFFAVALILFAKQRAGRESLLLLGFFIPLILLSLFLDMKYFRYIFFIFPLLVIGASYGICKVWDWYRAHRTSPLSSAIPVIIGLLLLYVGAGLVGSITDDYQPLPYEAPHPHWEFAADYVEHNLREGEVVVSTMPICTLHYLGKTDYWLRQNEYYAFTGEDGVIRDRYSGAVILTDHTMVVNELSGKDGWLIADKRLESYFTDPDVLAYVEDTMSLVPEGSDHTIRVYRFENG